MITDRERNSALLQENTPVLPRVAGMPGPDLSLELRRPRRTRLVPVPLQETTTAVMRSLRTARVDLLHEYFEQMCDRRPHKTAVICGPHQITYQELDHLANRLAHFLISRGISKNSSVGILLDYSLDTYIALLGVLKAGAAFVPLDPAVSVDLMAFIAEDARLQGMITASTFREKTQALPCPVFELDREDKAISMQPENRLHISIEAPSLCYATYTPYTTHQLRGIAISHSDIVSALRTTSSIYHMTHNDRVYQEMSTVLDFSLSEIWSTWMAGATLVADPTTIQYTGHKLTQFLVDHKITVLCCTPELLATIEADLPSLRSIFISGGRCPSELASLWSFPRRRILNMYSPAGTTLKVSWCELLPGRPNILGTPLPGYYVYILNDHRKSVKDGECGEICIGGPGFTLGYLNHPDLTGERFIPNPILSAQERLPRLYRTGNLGRFTPSGQIEYLGCIDPEKIADYHIRPVKREKRLILQIHSQPFSEDNAALQLEATSIFERKTKRFSLSALKRIHPKNIYRQVMTDPLYKNSLFYMASTFILGALGFVFWMIIARLYKASSVGIATTLISIMTLLSSFSIMGFNSSLNRYLPRSTDKGKLINLAFAIVTLVTFIISFMFLLGSPLFSPQLAFLRSNVFYSISFIVFIIFCAWNSLVESVFMAFRIASSILVKNIIISIAKLILPLLLVALGSYGIFASVSAAIALGVSASLLIMIARLKIRFTFAVDTAMLKETSAYSFANYLMDFMFNAPSLILPVLILDMLSAEYAAYFYIASMIQNMLLIIPLAAAQSLLTEGSYNEKELKRHVKKALTTVFVILTPAIMCIGIGGNILLQLFGKNYASQAFQFLQLYSISTIFTSFLLIANAIYNIKHQKKALVLLNIFASVLTLWLSYAFVSARLVGIGWGWLLGQAIAGGIALLIIINAAFKRE